MDKKKKSKIILAILIVVLVVSVSFIVVYFVKQNNAKNEYKDLQSKAKVKETTKETPDESQEDGEYKSPIDFEELWKTNEEIYAWIQIPGTDIDYPIAQRADDDAYYLNHTIEGTEGLPGSIYTEAINSKDFSDFNTVIYGHNMKNGTMFAGLHKYEDKEFLKENPYVYIYLPDKTLKYQIFAAVVFDDRHVMHSFDYSTPEGRQQFLDEIKGVRTMESGYDENVTVGTDSNIITLATCIGGQPDNRWLVEAVLVDDGTK
ncbi:class B sortase [Roseburia sp. MSJ-14]|uniref:class B sortase n=1 Tax=Roseburia sp. MSJ-14 TaxID=2841514 RepID=UPI001C1029C7|nr:class B sortase [Roseburia sp. MSJ-14]MBU5474510.1 class B sortase [Roseburia sp. MSJ-14]